MKHSNDSSRALLPDPPASLIVINADRRPQFAWYDVETEQYYSEADGKVIVDVLAAMPWAALSSH
ncbi:hypothetical protein QHI69_37015 [Burkholderia gladioli pv. gladioli]|uniref:Uncharacterized protein n=1 Tax=Burkholderia gladioli TaxID=28095 RepID=A0AAW3F9B2_BURGA|nr:hypothetical protein [Burkholderia gladioli]AJW93791.1 hypothetical protein BM43_7313 [Burkholderia gladioli]ASD84681.1 hypothetical protein CEJ98_37620 [Burkholderia gladioli pv. gladioli]AWY49799.1 hypothetical protein A8H28_00605 [Burkholderia gladioli pv. gladioli]KGC17818.1 hypothetical protein DM48_3317 [Burkholderia gladioli]MDJ1167529.1 hypothetical protein [Burkholderia gladioli pv. gladioli]